MLTAAVAQWPTLPIATYTVDGDILTLVGGNGTVEPGKVYELILVKD